MIAVILFFVIDQISLDQLRADSLKVMKIICLRESTFSNMTAVTIFSKPLKAFFFQQILIVRKRIVLVLLL